MTLQPGQPPIVRTLYAMNRVMCRAWHRTDVRNVCTVPETGPAIVVGNHISSLDPFFIQASCPRVIRWMVAREYTTIPIASGLMRKLMFIPVNRGSRDIGSFREASRQLDRGEVLGVFPEGTFSDKTRNLLHFHSGAAMLAIHSGVPVVPVALEGTMRKQSVLRPFLEGHEARISWGEPAVLKGDVNAAIAALKAKVQSLLDGLR
jgi:1-acyl-sn-glycerol-3-phosphate acyltransferase